MASHLEVQYLSGDFETHTLDRKTPVSIGSHFSNDICIDEGGVEKVHCRISWKKGQYQAQAGSSDGLEINGSLHKKKTLTHGDVISIGSIDIAVKLDKSDQLAASPAKSGESGKSKTGKQEEELIVAQILDDDDDDDFGTASAADDFDEEFDEDPRSKKREQKAAPVSKKKSEEKSPAEDGEDDEQKGTQLSALEKMKARMATQSVRPGERDALRSPFVLGLGGGVLVLLLASATFYFMIGSETAQRQFDAAVAERSAGKYSQSIKLFEGFITQYPQHQLTDQARLIQKKVLIEKEISGATPAWNRGLENLKEFIKVYREEDTFKEQHTDLLGYAEKITLGAAKTAGASKQDEFLEISNQAEKLYKTYASKEEPPEELFRSFDVAQKDAELAIRKQNIFDAAIAEIEKHLSSKPPRPIPALIARRKLIETYADLEKSKEIRALTNRLRETELGLIQLEEIDRDAAREERPAFQKAPFSLIVHNRSRTDQERSNRNVFAIGADCCYGIDTVTGEPVWRRVIGLNTPFFPMTVQTTEEALLLFDTNFNELTLLNRSTGKLIWRQAVEGTVTGPPELQEGQLYLPTKDGHLYKLSLETGKISHRMTFSQPVHSPPLFVAENEHLVIAGSETLTYTVSVNPLKCVAVSETGQKPGSIEAPLMRMGALMLMCENDRATSCALRVFQFQPDGIHLEQVGDARVEGHVRATPVIRGKQLLVASGAERVTAFTVADGVDQRILTELGSLQLQNPIATPMFLTAGADGLFWLASSAVRKYQVSTDAIALGEGALGVGLYTQPLQSIGEKMFIGRRVPYGEAIHFSLTDREELAGFGRVILGNEILATTVNSQGSLIALTQSGHVFRPSEAEVSAGGYKTETLSQIDLQPPKLDAQLAVLQEGSQPLQAVRMTDGRMAAWCGLPNPRVFIFKPSGELEQSVALKTPLEAPPVALKAGVALAVSGRVRLITTGVGSVEEFLAQAGGENAPHWTHMANLDDQQLIIVNSDGKLSRIQYRTSPRNYLGEGSSFNLGSPVDVPFALADGKLFLATASGRLIMMDALSWEVQAEQKLDTPATNALYAVGDHLFVETGQNAVMAFDLKNNLQPLWQKPVELPNGLSGKPLQTEKGLVISSRTGEILLVDPAQGTIMKTQQLHQPTNSGPLQIYSSTMISTIDGSLHSLDPLLNQQEATP